MKFRTAVEDTDEIAAYLRSQLDALDKAHRNRIHAGRTSRIAGSVDIDSALQSAYPNARRWDYVVGYRRNNQEDRAYFIEVHPAEAGEVERVLGKKKWLEGWMQGKALGDVRPREFVWLSAGGIRIPPNSPHKRRLSAHGLKLVRTLWLR